MKGNISAGNVAEFIVYLNMLTFPVMSLGWVTSLIQRAAASQKRINEFLHEQPEIISPKVPKAKYQVVELLLITMFPFIYPDTGIQALKSCLVHHQSRRNGGYYRSHRFRQINHRQFINAHV